MLASRYFPFQPGKTSNRSRARKGVAFPCSRACEGVALPCACPPCFDEVANLPEIDWTINAQAASCFDRINRIKQDDLLLLILCILSKELLDLRPDYFGIVSNPPTGVPQGRQG